MIVDYYLYKGMDFACTKCGWRGKGAELKHGEFSEEHSIGDLECPKCYKMIACWQAPLTKDVFKTKTKFD